MLGGSKLFGRFLTALIVLGLCVSVANAEQIEVLNGGFILSGIVERAAFGGSSVQGGVPGYTQRKRIDDSMHLYVPSGRAAFGAASNDQDLAVVLSLKEALAECQYLMEQTGAAHCSPDYMVYASEIVPNDSSYDRIQGAMDLIEAPLAWEITRGSDEVVVAVLDTGVDYNHPDLRDNMWVNPGEVAGNGVDDDGNGVVDDVHGYNARANNGNPMDDNAHGTHCAGTIGARGNSGFGIAGVNWNVKIMALKFLDANGRGGLSGAIQALAYVRKMKTQFGVNVRVTNNSWGGGGTSAPSEYMVKVYPIENDFDRFETIGPVSSRDECAAKAMEMKAAAYECQPN